MTEVKYYERKYSLEDWQEFMLQDIDREVKDGRLEEAMRFSLKRQVIILKQAFELGHVDTLPRSLQEMPKQLPLEI